MLATFALVQDAKEARYCLSAFLLAQGVFKHNSDCHVYNRGAAVIQLSDIVMQAECSYSDLFVIMMGDLNKANLKKEMLKVI